MLLLSTLGEEATDAHKVGKAGDALAFADLYERVFWGGSFLVAHAALGERILPLEILHFCLAA